MSSAIPIGANKVMAGVGNPCSTLLLITLPDVLKVSGFVGPSAVLSPVIVVVDSPELELTVTVQVDLTIAAGVCGTSPGWFTICGFTGNVVGLSGFRISFSSSFASFPASS